MTVFDALQGAWRTQCPHEHVAVELTLHAFRSISRLPGPRSPAAYQVQVRCPACENLHVFLFTQGQLDADPVLDPVGVHFDFMIGRMTWSSDLRSAWQSALQRGRWPLMLTCRAERETLLSCDDAGELSEIVVAPRVGAWPSLLRRITPDSERTPRSYEVQYVCPRCDAPGCELWTSSDLLLIPSR